LWVLRFSQAGRETYCRRKRSVGIIGVHHCAICEACLNQLPR
jgi:hypothetical protein